MTISASTRSSRSLGARIRAARVDYLFVVPGLIIFGAFIFWPLIASLYYSTLDWTGFGKSAEYVGLANYRELLRDPFFLSAFGRSFPLHLRDGALSDGAGAGAGDHPQQQASEALHPLSHADLLPVVSPVAVIGIVWVLMLSPFNGPVNDMLTGLHLVSRAVDFLGSPQIVLWTLAGIFVWKWTGVTLVYWLAALQTVPDELYEAARLDGVKPWQTLIYMVLPIVAPFAVVIGLISAIAAMNVFPLIQATTGGGPFFSSEVMEVYIFRTAFAPASGQFPRLGYASAAGVLFGFAMMILTLAQGLAVRRARARRAEHD